MAEKVYFGVPDFVVEIPAPSSGMGFDSELDSEAFDLVSGGRSVYRAPTAFKTFNMSWNQTSAAMQTLIDMYNGQFGSGPFYITDPTVNQQNILPPRWSNCWQLAHQANGWCRPQVMDHAGSLTPSPTTPRTNKKVKFTQRTAGASVKTSGVLRTRAIRVPGRDYFVGITGTATGGAGVILRAYNKDTRAWVTVSTITTLTGLVQNLIPAANATYVMLELDIYMPLGSTLELVGMTLGTVNYSVAGPTQSTWMPVGDGVGAVQFTSGANGTLVSSVVDRIGLSLDFTEVQSVGK